MYRFAIAALVLSAGACAPVSSSNPPSVAYDRNSLSRTELAARANDHMYTVISGLRPNWITTPMGASGVGNTSATAAVMIYIDGREYGDVDQLKSISAETVEIARYYSATAAQSKFGLRAASPVIEITSRGRTPR